MTLYALPTIKYGTRRAVLENQFVRSKTLEPSLLIATWLKFWADEASARFVTEITTGFDIRLCGSDCAEKVFNFFHAETVVLYRLMRLPSH